MGNPKENLQAAHLYASVIIFLPRTDNRMMSAELNIP